MAADVDPSPAPACEPAMAGVPAAFEQPIDRAEFRRPAARPGVELYRAHIVHHHFAPHFHDGYGLGVVEGVERFRYRGREHVASAGSIVLMQPGELHTGGPAVPQGWRYRMLYLDEATLADRWQDGSPWRFAETVRQEPARAAALARALAALWQAAEHSDHDALAFDEALADALGLIAPLSATGPGTTPAMRTAPVAFRRVVDCLHADLAREWHLAELAALAGLSPFHFQRAFKAHYQVSAHQWRMALRLAEAKRRLARGEPAAEVAAAVGLADQAHLTRRFAGMYGVTPARYQRQLSVAGPARPAAPARRRPPSARRG